jgi:hypothetical protein
VKSIMRLLGARVRRWRDGFFTSRDSISLEIPCTRATTKRSRIFLKFSEIGGMSSLLCLPNKESGPTSIPRVL